VKYQAIVRTVAALSLSLGVGATASAQDNYPERPIKFVVPSAPGGSPDVLSRVITAELGKLINQTIVVDNKPGAAGSIGIVQIKDAKPDGYTIGYGNINTLSVNRSLFKKLPYDTDKDLKPVGQMFSIYNALIVPADSPVKSVQDLVARAKAEPGKLSYGASGVGTTGHMGGELFKSLAGFDALFVPYNSGPAALQDLMGGRLDYMFTNSSEAAPLVASGKVRAIGVSSKKRLALFPDVPTLDEAGVKGYETVAWGGIVAPAGTPDAVVSKLNTALQKALTAPEVQKSLATFGADAVGGSPADFQKLMDDEAAKWARIIEEAKIERLD
jgi:tripartite-type tricarboxylate transporter receptor subunit TctC